MRWTTGSWCGGVARPGRGGPPGGTAGVDEPRDRGTATVELAIAMVGIVLVMTAVLTVAGVGVARLDVEDAARAGTREAITGASDTEIVAAATRAAGDGARVRIERQDGWVSVQVERPVVGRWGTWTVEGRRTGRIEPLVGG